MKIPDLAVDRKVTVFMITIAVLLFGLLSLSKLGLELLPDMEFPSLSIITNYQGASPEDIEETITKPIEKSIATVKGIKNVSSNSIENYSVIMVEFEWGVNLDLAAQDLRDVIDQVSGYLPRDITRPMVLKFDLSQMPVLSYAITGSMDNYHLRKVLDDEISLRLSQLDGVASVRIIGGEEREIQINVDKQKLEFYNISINDLQLMLGANNMNMPAGYITDRKEEFLLRAIAQFSSIEEIANTPLTKTMMGETIYVKDVAKVETGLKETRNIIRIDKQPTIYLMVLKESGTNTLTVSNTIINEVERIEKDYGEQVIFHEIMDMGRPIQKVTSQASSNLLVGAILAILMVFIFLQNWRPTVAISIAVPISVVATFASMYLAKFSLNLMTIGGLALGVGMLVDNAIIVIENIYRHLEMGKDRLQAAKDGTSEVGMAITASTLTTIAVFVPMVFAEGMTGILIRGLALTVAFSLFCSLIVALTVVPAFASQTFRYDPLTNNKSQRFFERFKVGYQKMLKWVLHHRAVSLISVAILFLVSLGLFVFIGTDFMPEGEMPVVILKVKLPLGTTLDETESVISQIEDVFSQTPGISSVLGMIGPLEESAGDSSNPQDVNEAQVIATIVDQKERDLNTSEIREYIRDRLPDYEGVEIKFFSAAGMMGSSTPVNIKIFGSDLNRLKHIAETIEERINGIPNVADVTNSVKESKNEAHIVIDKMKAFEYGLTAGQIVSAINTASVGSLAGIYRTGGEEIDIRVRFAPEFREHQEDIMSMTITSPIGVAIPLTQIASIQYTQGPTKISRENQTRVVEIAADIVGTNDIGGKVKEIQADLTDITDSLPSGYFVTYGGSFKDMQEAFKTLTLALTIAVILVYLVMASQFESLRQPFVIMFTIPLAAIGVVFALFLSGNTLSVASFIGGIILAGIVVNNGIVLVDHTNQLRRKGMEKHEALIQAGADRMRPVLITALTTIIGMLPMAMSAGEGSEIKVPLALTIIGGLTSATFFTLLVIPAIYSVIEGIRYKK